MGHEEEHVFLFAQPEQPGAEQRRRRQVERFGDQRVEPAAQPVLAFVRRQAGEILQRQLHRQRGMDALVRAGRVRLDRGAQHRLAPHHRAQRLLEGGHVQHAMQAVRRGRVIGHPAGLQLLEVPHALLHQRQRRVLAVGQARDHARLPRAGRAGGADRRRQPRHGRRLEHGAQRQREPQLAVEPRGELRGEQGMPAVLEEVVVQPRFDTAQHRGHRLRYLALQFVARRGARAGRRAGGERGRQAGAVDLAVGQQRQRGQHHEVLRQHVFGQVFAQAAAQGGFVHRRFARQIGDQARVARAILAHHHQRLRHRRMAGQLCLDLAGFDAEAA